MNHAYRLIWSEARQAYVAVAEIARARGKKSAAALLLSAVCLAVPAFAANLPQGGSIVAGSGSISQSGNTLTVTQATDRLAANWQSFSIGQGYAVNFVQPSASAVALNRVLGSDVSVIQGALRANGQVFLLNPNGVLFTPTAQVEVGGLVASTLNLSNEDFLAGRYRFAGESANSVINQGSIRTAPGGTVALIAARIENTGSIEAPRGHVLMGAGGKVTLDLGGPVRIQVEEGALDALIQQGGAIKADGGLVYLTAKAANDLASAAINHSGITEAKTLATGERGEIWLMGDMARGQVNVAGTLDASAPAGMRGGFVETSAAKVKVLEGASVRAGHWLIDPNDFTIAATGGDITGATLSASLASGDVTIQSASGATSGNGDIFVRDDVTWSSGNTLTLSAYRNIEILATLDASAGSGGKVALEYGQGAPASGNTATYSFGLTGTGFTGKINLQAGNNFTTKLGSDGTVDNWTVITSLGSAGDETSGPTNSLQGLAYSGNLSGNYVLGADIDASATSGWNGGAGFVPIGDDTSSFTGRFDGLGHVITNLTINRPATNYVGLFGRATGSTLRNVGLTGGSVTGVSYVGGLVGATGFGTVSQSYATGSVTGEWQVGGLAGSNIGTVSQSYATGSVTGSHLSILGAVKYVGGLVGRNDGMVNQSYATGKVTATGNEVGGLVGRNDYMGMVNQSYATGNVTGIYDPYKATGNSVGGLVGRNDGMVNQSYANGAVSGYGTVGGLVGYNYYSTVSQSYATGSVTGNSAVGGLVGFNAFSTVSASFWDTDTSGQATSAGGTGLTTAQMKQLATYTAAAWDIDDAGGTGKVWRIYDGQSYPLLRAFLTPLAIDAASAGGKTYDGVAVSSLPAGLFTISSVHDAGKILFGGTLPGQKNAGSYTAAIYSNQTGYDLIGTRSVGYTITPKALSITGTTVANKVYDGTTSATVTPGTLSGFVGSETVNVASATGAFDNKNAGTGKTVTVAYTLSDGANGGLAANYTLAGTTHSADITPKSLTASYSAANKVYDGTTAATVSATSGDIITGDAVTIGASGAFTDKNVGAGKTVSVSGGALSGADAGNYSLANPTGMTTADITPKALTVSGITAADKVYDGTTGATLTYGDGNFAGLISGDVVTASGAFADKNVGTGKTVNLSFGGADAGNYTFGGQSTASADITPKSLTASYSAANKVYDGTTAATVSATSGDIIGGDAVTIAASGAFTDKNVGAGKTVSVSGGALSGADAGNYSLANPTGMTTADITPKALTVSGITAADKVYDGTTGATLTYGDGNFAGLISGDVVTASGAFADRNVGAGKTVNLSFGGADAGNYTFSGQSTATADITPRPVQVRADAKSKTEGQSDPPLTYATGCPTGYSADCGLVSGETLAGSLSRDAGEAVGAYAIRQGTVTDANNPNYAIDFAGADLSISAVALTGASGDALASVQQAASSSGAGTAPTPTPETSTGSHETGAAPLLAALIRVEGSGIRLPEGFLVDEDERNRRR